MVDVIVVGAGPAGLVAALALARAGVTVRVLESNPHIPINLRGSTFHPSTLDMLEHAFGAASDLMARGLRAPMIQYRRHGVGPIAQFDFGDIADLTDHPFRVQAEQYKLCQSLHAKLLEEPTASLEFNAPVREVIQTDDHVEVHIEGNSRPVHGAFVVGADGANSVVRRCSGIAFDGFTWPERFLVVSTPFDFRGPFPELSSVSYVADPDEWYFLLQVPELWRVMFPIRADETDTEALDGAAVQRRLHRVHPANQSYEIAHTTLYKVHQRVAATYRAGRILLTGDAAHVNNPLGGMGMNGGIHDSFMLAKALAEVVAEGADLATLDDYANVRRQVSLEYIQRISIQNKNDLEAASPETQAAFESRLKAAETDGRTRREFLKRLAMLPA